MATESTFSRERNTMHQHFRTLMPETAKNFDDLMSITFAAGALSIQAKELIALGVSVAVRCEPCMNYHIEQARAKGATDEKLLEAMGVGFEMGVGQLIPPLRRVLRSQFGDKKEASSAIDAGLVQARPRQRRPEPENDLKAEHCHRMWTLY